VINHSNGKGKATFYVGGLNLDIASYGTPVAPAYVLNTPHTVLTTPADDLNTPPPFINTPPNSEELHEEIVLWINKL
jgi:hypothetical protein